MLKEKKELVAKLCETSEEFKKLFDEHIAFEQDLEALYSLKFFPPEVEAKIKELKFLKLKGKDRLNQIITKHKSENK